jgi:hypothetical protein
MVQILRRLGDSPESTLSEAVNETYYATLYKFHGFFASSAFRVGAWCALWCAAVAWNTGWMCTSPCEGPAGTGFRRRRALRYWSPPGFVVGWSLACWRQSDFFCTTPLGRAAAEEPIMYCHSIPAFDASFDSQPSRTQPPLQVAFAFVPNRGPFLERVAGGSFDEQTAAEMAQFVEVFTGLLAEVHTFLVGGACVSVHARARGACVEMSQMRLSCCAAQIAVVGWPFDQWTYAI